MLSDHSGMGGHWTKDGRFIGRSMLSVELRGLASEDKLEQSDSFLGHRVEGRGDSEPPSETERL